MQRKPKLYGPFQGLIVLCSGLAISIGVLALLNYRISAQVNKAQTEAQDAVNLLNNINDTDSYQKISFINKLHKETKHLPRSEHIPKLIDVLQTVKTINTTNGTIDLYDFVVNLDSIEISGKASSLSLLYYPETSSKTGLISAVSQLKFLDNIHIQSYLKEDDMYEFTLYATILLDETPQQ